jgi:hypothetical protein
MNYYETNHTELHGKFEERVGKEELINIITMVGFPSFGDMLDSMQYNRHHTPGFEKNYQPLTQERYISLFLGSARALMNEWSGTTAGLKYSREVATDLNKKAADLKHALTLMDPDFS